MNEYREREEKNVSRGIATATDPLPSQESISSSTASNVRRFHSYSRGLESSFKNL